jgi:hypothetical protein
MARTPEQKAADDALTAAIDAAVEAYGYREDVMMNTSYIVLVEQRGWDDDADSLTGVVRLYKDGDMSWISILGLLRAASLAAERTYVTERWTE